MLRTFDLSYDIIKETAKQIKIRLNRAVINEFYNRDHSDRLRSINLLFGDNSHNDDGAVCRNYHAKPVYLGKKNIYDPYNQGVEYYEDMWFLRYFEAESAFQTKVWSFDVKELKRIVKRQIGNDLKTDKQIIFPKAEIGRDYDFPSTPMITKYSSYTTGSIQYYNGFPQDFLELNKRLFGG